MPIRAHHAIKFKYKTYKFRFTLKHFIIAALVVGLLVVAHMHAGALVQRVLYLLYQLLIDFS